MREAKYRAWHKDAKIMFDVNGMSPTAVEEKRGGMNFVYSRGDVVLMQYTGLKDRSGTDIYEGDIVKAQDPYPHIEKGYKYYICEVMFTEGATFLLRRRYDCYGTIKTEYFSVCIMEVEVIGNIFENSEMLEEEKLCR